MPQAKPQFILMPAQQVDQMKNLIADLSHSLRSVCFTPDKIGIDSTLSRWQQAVACLERVCHDISIEFEDGVVNKKTLEAQIDSMQSNLREAKEQLADKQKQVVKFSSQLLKTAQENDKLREYIRRMKEDNKNYKAQMEEMVEALALKNKKAKKQYEETLHQYEAKIKFMETKAKSSSKIEEDLDKQLEQLAKLEGELSGQDQ